MNNVTFVLLYYGAFEQPFGPHCETFAANAWRLDTFWQIHKQSLNLFISRFLFVFPNLIMIPFADEVQLKKAIHSIRDKVIFEVRLKHIHVLTLFNLGFVWVNSTLRTVSFDTRKLG